MGTKEYLEALDWDSVIAAKKGDGDMLNLGIARCFKDGKDGKYTEAIENLSMAINQAADDSEKAKAYYYRAYGVLPGG